MWFWTADLHLNHSNIIKYCKRPFLSREEEGLISMADSGTIPASEIRISQESNNRMTDAIINSINAVVGVGDSMVVVGDFCWTPRDDRFAAAKKLRDRIKCENLYLIWGNHDDRKILSPLFKACYDQYVFNIDGQNVFASHYPCRSWDRAYHGSWDVYGHVHNLYSTEDNGELMPYEKQVFSDGFISILEKYEQAISATNEALYSFPENQLRRSKVVDELLAVCASLKGIDLTLDVGVDNLIRGDSVPFGTPWSMDELRAYMDKKKPRWEARSEGYKRLKPASSFKVGNAN